MSLNSDFFERSIRWAGLDKCLNNSPYNLKNNRGSSPFTPRSISLGSLSFSKDEPNKIMEETLYFLALLWIICLSLSVIISFQTFCNWDSYFVYIDCFFNDLNSFLPRPLQQQLHLCPCNHFPHSLNCINISGNARNTKLHKPLSHLRVAACLSADAGLHAHLIALDDDMLDEFRNCRIQYIITMHYMLVIPVNRKRILCQVVSAKAHEIKPLSKELVDNQRRRRDLNHYTDVDIVNVKPVISHELLCPPQF